MQKRGIPCFAFQACWKKRAYLLTSVAYLWISSAYACRQLCQLVPKLPYSSAQRGRTCWKAKMLLSLLLLFGVCCGSAMSFMLPTPFSSSRGVWLNMAFWTNVSYILIILPQLGFHRGLLQHSLRTTWTKKSRSAWWTVVPKRPDLPISTAIT